MQDIIKQITDITNYHSCTMDVYIFSNDFISALTQWYSLPVPYRG